MYKILEESTQIRQIYIKLLNENIGLDLNGFNDLLIINEE